MQFPQLWTDNCADLLKAFNNQGVQYLLIGSMAKSHYCRQPRVNDMDLMINPTPKNVRQVVSALRTVDNAVDLTKLSAEIERALVEGGQQMPLFHAGNVEIFAPSAKRFNFRKAFSRSREGLVLGIPVQIASICDLKTLDSLGHRATNSKVDELR